jgi:hypothetical protein
VTPRQFCWESSESVNGDVKRIRRALNLIKPQLSPSEAEVKDWQRALDSRTVSQAGNQTDLPLRENDPLVSLMLLCYP